MIRIQKKKILYILSQAHTYNLYAVPSEEGKDNKGNRYGPSER
jgi:hypothetical protein